MSDTFASFKAPMPGIIASILVKIGDQVKKGDSLLAIEVMKMESVIVADQAGVIDAIHVNQGDVVEDKQVLIRLKLAIEGESGEEKGQSNEQKGERKDLAELKERKYFTQDEARPAAIAKRKSKGFRTARENIADLCEGADFREYGSLIIAAQRRRRKEDDLIANTPADGIITGVGGVNANLFGEEESQCMILAYDYTVLAGTQGMFGHKKTDRVLHVAKESEIPVILFAEGGGGRPGDTDFQGVGGLDVMTFALFAGLNGVVPRVAIVAGYCFAGNAALAGCADVIIATENSSLGMGGPAMIEGGGLGVFHPKEVGPSEVQDKNGVIDVLVKDETEAVAAAKKYLSYFQGEVKDWEADEQEKLREAIPENRKRIYEIHSLIQILADKDSVLELRPNFAPGMITAFIRIEGKPLGLIANNPKHLGGAIDSLTADKASRFMQLCNVFGIPILSLCDTPGFMVGPDAEKGGTVRHASRMFTIGAKLEVPIFTIVLRKAYGLGSMAMAGGSMHAPFFCISWPTGEFGGMGLEGAVRLGYRKELEAVEDPVKREALYEKMVAKAYRHGRAINTAAYLEIDEVIDPAESRSWIVKGLASNKKKKGATGRGFVDTW